MEGRLDGYHGVTQSVTLQKSQKQELSLPALRAMVGSLNVGYTPMGAEVRLDGKRLGTSPEVFSQIGAGSHSLQISKDGYETKELTVTVSEGATTDVTGSLSRAASSGSSRTFTANGVSFDMVFVEGGTFMMGAAPGYGGAFDDEKPRHQVTLAGYHIGKTEVTQALWQAVMGGNPSYFKGASLPVESVSWGDCQEFIRKLNALTGQSFRLPTEAEWEYAARGGSKGKNHLYSGSDDIDEAGWYDGNSGAEPHPVGQKQANELGLHDMTGNVWEWCSDWYGPYGSSPQTDPAGPSTGADRVIRGGSWYSGASYCRASLRYYSTPGDGNSNLGLRLAIRL